MTFASQIGNELPPHAVRQQPHRSSVRISLPSTIPKNFVADQVFRFWEIAIPIMVIVIPMALWSDLEKFWRYVQKRSATKEAIKVGGYGCSSTTSASSHLCCWQDAMIMCSSSIPHHPSSIMFPLSPPLVCLCSGSGLWLLNSDRRLDLY